MYGYTAQQAAAAAGYANYGSYAQSNYAQQPQGQAAGQLGTGTTSTTYSGTGYSYPTTASAYAQYGQTATQQQSTTPVGYNQQQQPSVDYTSDYASMFKTNSSGAAGYGTIGAATGGRPSAASGAPQVMSNANSQSIGTKHGVNGGASNAANNHYAGYEAAVYAAASSYLQAKTTGNQWLGGGANKRVGGAAMGAAVGNRFQANKFQSKFTANKYPGSASMGTGYQKKRYGLGLQNREVQTFYCEVCKISCGGNQTYKEHLEGKSHKKKEAISRGENVQSVPRSKVSFKCDVCNVTCTGRDTYDAHAKGIKHQKTVALLKKMNKPLPTLEPTIIPPKDVIPASGPTKKIVGVTGTKFVAGSKLSTTNSDDTTADATNTAVEQALLAESNVKPVGEEFIDEQRDGTGKLIEYRCKLCECKFSDPNAKEIHLKGRRHRLQYKAKVNPALEVETKMTGSYGRKQHQLKQTYEQQVRRRNQAMGPPPPFRPLFGPPLMMGGPYVETSDDRHVIAKCNSIQPSKPEHEAAEKLVTLVEKTLKSISDKFAEEAAPVKTEVTEGEKPVEPERLLKGVMRVGLLAKNLLLKTDLEVELVVLCSQIPTQKLLKEIAELFPKQAQKDEAESLKIVGKIDESCMLITLSSIPLTCRVTFTCVLIREVEKPTAAADGTAESETPIEKPADALPTVPCLKALAELRHAKWYQVKCAQLTSANITLKIIRDISTRVKTWMSLSTWAMELLVEKTLSSINMPLSPGDAVRRVFEAIAGGVILNKNATLLDPCEKETTDVLALLKEQEREDITSSAQHALRLISFNQIFKILAIERIPDLPPIVPHAGERKRPRESNGISADGAVDAKKDKKEETKTEVA